MSGRMFHADSQREFFIFLLCNISSCNGHIKYYCQHLNTCIRIISNKGHQDLIYQEITPHTFELILLIDIMIEYNNLPHQGTITIT